MTVRLMLVVVWLCLAGVAFGQGQAQAPTTTAAATSIEPNQTAQSFHPIGPNANPGAGPLPDLPPTPKGKASLMGGTIRKIDHVRDQMTLEFFGGGSGKILFDGRTKVLRDGSPSTLKELKAGDRVYLETVLDGTTVFARNIRVIVQSGQGHSDGQVLSYRPEAGELTVRDALSPEPLKLRLTADSEVLREGRKVGATELQQGTLIAAEFLPAAGSDKSVPIARRISILAQPGTQLVFSGRIVTLDLHTGLLILLNPQDGKNYEVYLDPAASAKQESLHEGTEVTVNTRFDGTRYAVSSISINPTTPQ